MSKTILIHSFRHGVGRSTIAANLAFLLASEGQRVAIIDTSTKAPATHLLFGLKEDDMAYSFNDYLLGQCDIQQAAHNVTGHLKESLKGQIFLVPANTKSEKTARQLNDAQDALLLNTGCQTLIDSLGLDALLIDTQPGVSETALVAITVADTLVMILGLSKQDYQGTGVTMDVVRQLDVPRVVLIVNEAPTAFDFDEIETKMEQTYNCEVVAVLPHLDEVMALANKDIFALRYPNHSLTTQLRKAAINLTS